jgi:DNA modification methylase
MTYQDLLTSKFKFTKAIGFEVDLSTLNPWLKPHCRDIVRWALFGGRRAIFASFGLHKTSMQLEIMAQIGLHESGRRLIIAPLTPIEEFIEEAGKMGIAISFVKSSDEVGGDGIYITNYESVRDGKLDVDLFMAVSLDEASVLRSYGSKTYQEFLTLFGDVKYRFVATATPSPNRHKELIHYAGFLGIMDTGQALTRFFQRDSTQANNLTLYPHMELEFYTWLHSWAIFIQKPSDLGHSDLGYDLPPIQVRYHEVSVENLGGKVDRDGQTQLINDAAIGLKDAAEEKRNSISQRVAKVVEIVAADPEDHFIVWHDLEDERRALEEVLPTHEFGEWHEFKDGNTLAIAMYERHYSCRELEDRKLIAGPGEKMVLLSKGRDALFVWRKFIEDSGQKGINCAVFRNEGPILSSVLIREACAIAWQRWPGERLYTYVDADAVLSDNPGYCYLMAGWERVGETKGGLIVLEALPGSGADLSILPIEKQVIARSVYGSQDPEERSNLLRAFRDGQLRILSTKPIIAGSGGNFQRHCHREIFSGIGYKFNDFIQAIYRVQRFGQAHEVIIDIIYTETERQILAELKRKWEEDTKLRARMSHLIRKHGLSTAGLENELKRSIGVTRKVESGAHFEVAHNDCVEETRIMADNSVDLIHTSIPFGNHYEYSANYNDFGHNEDNEAFFRQMDYLTPELLRVLRPGRVAAIHVKDRIRFGNVTGYGMPSVEPFHSDCIVHYRKHGFIYMGMITVVTDVVRENNQTYRLGWSEQCKDGTKMGVGSPEYILLFRKLPTDTGKAYADIRVEKSKKEYTRARWQVDAHAFWRSNGDRLLTAEEMQQLGPEQIGRVYQEHSLESVYDHEQHIALGEALEDRGALPATFMTLAPASHHEDVWHDINRMLTLNGEQEKRNLEQHICCLQLDIIERIIRRYTNAGEIVFDPFGGLMSVPYVAVKMGRFGKACELKAEYFRDGVRYMREIELKIDTPTLFDLMAGEDVA